MKKKNYKNYSAEDFVLDDHFRKTIRKSHGREQFLKKIPGKKAEIELAERILKGLIDDYKETVIRDKSESWQKIVHNHKRTIMFRFMRYAATVLLVVGLGTTYLFFRTNKSIEEYAASNLATYKDAELILSDGKKIAIQSKESKVQYTNDGSRVEVNDTTRMGQENLDNAFNQLIVPYGKRSTITLSDGSRVWLNSGSRLVYAPVFSGSEREVYLEGEGYFEVSKITDKPFYVKTPQFKIKVYGTKFDVQAYMDDTEHCAVLMEGKISIDVGEGLFFAKEIFMKPGQKASLAWEHREKKVNLSEVAKPEYYIDWIDGYLSFENETVDQLIKRVEHYYNIKIESRLSGRKVKISGKLDLKDDPQRVIATLAVLSKSRYVKQEDKYLYYE